MKAATSLVAERGRQDRDLVASAEAADKVHDTEHNLSGRTWGYLEAANDVGGTSGEDHD